jgi:DNA-binding transcriptional MerR regulator
MITTTEVAKRTGLSVKTLSRWANRGIIPKPATRTHPKGRGKIGYWPDHMLERCLRLAQLRKAGHDIETAAVMLQAESLSKNLEALDKPSLADVLDQKKVRASDGREISLLDVLLAIISADIRASVLDRDHHGTVIAQLRADNKLQLAMRLIQGGYNPYLTFDGREVRIEPDFLLCYGTSVPMPLFQLPLLPPIRKLFATLGAEELIREPRVMPAPKVWVNEGGVMVEYTTYLAGPLGFELLRHTAQTIGTTKGEEDDQGKSP